MFSFESSLLKNWTYAKKSPTLSLNLPAYNESAPLIPKVLKCVFVSSLQSVLVPP